MIKLLFYALTILISNRPTAQHLTKGTTKIALFNIFKKNLPSPGSSNV